MLSDHSDIESTSSLSSISLSDERFDNEIRHYHVDPALFENHPSTQVFTNQYQGASNLADSFAQTNIDDQFYSNNNFNDYSSTNPPLLTQESDVNLDLIFPMVTYGPVHNTSRTVYDMPSPGAKNAPDEFRGDYEVVERFIEHYERLLNQCNVIDDEEKCSQILTYCSRNVCNLIKALESFQTNDWDQLKKDLLDYYDADLATTRWKEKDLALFVKKSRKNSIRTLTKWKAYKRRFIRIANWLKTRKVIDDN